LALSLGLGGSLVLAVTLSLASGRFVAGDRSPGRRLGTIDNRGSHFYLTMYWADELAAQTDDTTLAAVFAPLAASLAASEEQIVAELLAIQGHPVNLGGYYHPDPALIAAVMRPSPTLNTALATLS
ncbi:MAG: NADP-dependent isocitrate dehydrogenase, partial [Promicromonosporaceae bacterium]|nr:NADP-dependent isocitrate dehydrogenase [Promicromonosporaceae bacterium]